MRKEEIDGTARWRNLLVIFNSPGGAEVVFVIDTDSVFVHLKDSQGDVRRVFWDAVQMRPVAWLCDYFINVDPEAIDVNQILAAHPSWREEAMALKKMMDERWARESLSSTKRR